MDIRIYPGESHNSGGIPVKLSLLDEIFETNQVTDANGNTRALHSAISREEGVFIHSLISRNHIESSVEIGCAFGISSLYICDALSQKRSPHHTIIDPCQSSDWQNIGVLNLRKAGFSFFDLIEEPSEIVLPDLLRRDKRFDFAFIDGWHTFDHALLDFFYVDRLLRVGGIVVFDDVDYPALKKLVRYISNYQSYEIIGSLKYAIPLSQRTTDSVGHIIARLIKLLPGRYARRIFADNIFRPDASLELHTSMMALRKTANDERSWDWYAPF